VSLSACAVGLDPRPMNPLNTAKSVIFSHARHGCWGRCCGAEGEDVGLPTTTNL